MGGNSFRDDRVCAAGVNCGPDCDAPGFVVNGTQGSPDGGSLEWRGLLAFCEAEGLDFEEVMSVMPDCLVLPPEVSSLLCSSVW